MDVPTAADWYVFGTAALCEAFNTPMVRVVDVFFRTSRPSREAVLGRLKAPEGTTIRYSNVTQNIVLSVDEISLLPQGGRYRVVGPQSVLEQHKVDIVDPWFGALESVRISLVMKLFPNLDWPEPLILKIRTDYAFAMQLKEHTTLLGPEIDNIIHDFAVN